MMKKIAIHILACSLFLVACSQKTDGVASTPTENMPKSPQAILDSVDFTEDGLNSLFTTHVSAEQFEALMLGFAKCEPAERHETQKPYKYDNCPAYIVYNNLNSNPMAKLDPSEKQAVLMKMLKHENHIVRDMAFSNVKLDANNNDLDAILAIARNETDPAVLSYFYTRLLSLKSLKSHSKIVAFLNENAANFNDEIRMLFIKKMPVSSAEGFSSVTQTILDICTKEQDYNEQKYEIKASACERIFDFDHDETLKLITNLLNDPQFVNTHGHILKKLQRKWNSDEETAADAYKLWLDYYKKKPRTNDVPTNEGLFLVINNDDIVVFKKKINFNENEFADVMVDIIADPNVSSSTHNKATDMLGSLVNDSVAKQKLKAAKATMNPAGFDPFRRSSIDIALNKYSRGNGWKKNNEKGEKRHHSSNTIRDYGIDLPF